VQCLLNCGIILGMATVTIPKSLAKKGDLVLIPLKEYESLLLGKKRIKTFAPTAVQKRALREARKGLVHGGYITLEQLRHGMGASRR